MVKDKSNESLDKAGDVLDQVNNKEILNSIKAENAKAEALLEEIQKQKIELILAGKANAGQEPAKKKTRTAKEYAKDFLEGKVDLKQKEIEE